MMRRRRRAPDFNAMVENDREEQLNTLADALAAEQGDAPEAERLTSEQEDYLWHWVDPNVRPEHLAQVGVQAEQKYGQETEEDGRPSWTPEQVQMAVQAAQQRALTPYRYDVIGDGRLELDEVWKNAERMRRRHQDCAECTAVAIRKAGMLAAPPMPAPMMPPAGGGGQAGPWTPATGEEPAPPMAGMM